MTPPDAQPMRRTGYTLTLLRKEADGRWRLARDANLLSWARLSLWRASLDRLGGARSGITFA